MPFFFVLLVLVLPRLACAQRPPSFPACSEVVAQLCAIDGKIPAEARETMQCLRRNADVLPVDCKQDIERYLQASRQASARGGGAMGSFGGMTSLTPPVPMAGYEGRASRDLYENKVSLSSPVTGSEKSVTSMSLGAGTLHFKNPVAMTSGQILPTDLYRVEVGTQFSRRLPDKKSFGLRVSAGSTGDQVFQAFRDANFSLAATYGFPGSDAGGYWIALVYFANNSTLGDYIPIPGIIYVHKTEHFTGVFGFPVLSLQWTPTANTAYSLSILGTTFITEAAYGSVTASQVFLQGSFNQQRYILHDRLQDRDRLTFQERKIGIGYRAPVFGAAFAEIQAGHAFGRSFYIGQKILNTDGGLAVLDDSAFVNASLKSVF